MCAAAANLVILLVQYVQSDTGLHSLHVMFVFSMTCESMLVLLVPHIPQQRRASCPKAGFES